jgi:eukaryotic-like serine/threonine-protein kinase
VADVLEHLRSALGDRYDVERLLGEGGMATVFLAKDLRHGRQVAIKTLRAELAASIGADRFLREIQLAANLQHPNILTLYDSGDAGGVLYYVMPFVEGESLRGRLNREQQLPLYDAVRITRESAEGLAYAHDHGVVHRDIKPENILLQNNHALVADFGIARALDAAGEKLTQTGMAVGTPHYMSPEQALGSDHADGRSDIYSLGCVLYELLAGQPPFDGPNSRAIMARHSMEQVPSLQIVRQSVPDELEDAVFQSLEKTPADRFQTMAEFADILADLEPTLATRRTSSRGVQAVRRTSRTTKGAVQAVDPAAAEAAEATATTTTATMAKKTSRITPFAMAKGIRFWSAAGLVALAAVAVGVWRLRGSAESATGLPASGLDPTKVAVLYFDKPNRGGDSLSFLADGLTEGLIHELSEVKALRVISQNGVTLYRNSAVAPDSIARALGVGTLVQGNIAPTGDKLRVNVSLVNPVDGTVIASKTLERPRAEIFALQDDLVKEVAAFLRERLGREVEVKESRVGTSKPEAWELLQKGEELVKEVDPLLAAADTAAAARHLASADSILTGAETLDPKWVTPIVKRGWLAYRELDLAGTFDKAFYLEWIGKGIGHAERALALKPNDADALELRGTLRYYRWILNLEPDASKAALLVADAEKDLRAATTANPNAAFAWSLLSHLLMGQSQTAEAKLAALKAYEADPYLTAAKQTVWRLFNASLDLEDAVEARHWCDEGQRRFPDYNRFVECRIWLYALKGQTPDVPQTWQLLEEYVRLTPPPQRDFQRRYGQMIVAMALARAGLKDSANSVANRARAGAELDPTRDLALLEAYVRVLLDERDDALRLLSTYIASNPQFRASLAKDQSWWFQSLRDEPRFKALAAGG